VGVASWRGVGERKRASGAWKGMKTEGPLVLRRQKGYEKMLWARVVGLLKPAKKKKKAT